MTKKELVNKIEELDSKIRIVENDLLSKRELNEKQKSEMVEKIQNSKENVTKSKKRTLKLGLMSGGILLCAAASMLIGAAVPAFPIFISAVLWGFGIFGAGLTVSALVDQIKIKKELIKVESKMHSLESEEINSFELEELKSQKEKYFESLNKMVEIKKTKNLEILNNKTLNREETLEK